jgi:hypothetical protein
MEPRSCGPAASVQFFSARATCLSCLLAPAHPSLQKFLIKAPLVFHGLPSLCGVEVVGYRRWVGHCPVSEHFKNCIPGIVWLAFSLRGVWAHF